MLGKNKFARISLISVKENIINHKAPIYNPIFLGGLDKIFRYKMLLSIFDKDFNKHYKKTYRYLPSNQININDIHDKKLIIIENIETLVNNNFLQEKIHEIINHCLKQDIQLILCSNIDVDKLEIDELIKSKMKYGLTLYLEDFKN